MKLLPLVLVLIALLPVPVRAETLSRTAVLSPIADDAFTAWTASGCVSPDYLCVDDDPVHDVDLTYLLANPGTPGTVVSSFQMDNLPSEAETITSFTAFMWIRGEAAGAIAFSTVYLMDGTACLDASASPTTIYFNASTVYALDCGGVDEWTPETVNAATFRITCEDDGAAAPEPNCRVTSIGFVVVYTYTGGSLTENEWAMRLAFSAFVLFLIVGVFGRSSFFLFLSGIVGAFLAFNAWFVSREEWSLVLFIILGPALIIMAVLGFLTGRADVA